MGDVWAWLLFFFIIIGVIVMVVFQLMCLADLEFDYINPYDSASRINKVILPEFITQGVLSLLFLLTGHWIMALLSIPYLYYNFTLYNRREHLIDVTEVFNMLNREKKKRLFKLGYLMLFLFMSLFWLIYSALEDDDHFA
ncbi:protein cornichon homolog 4 [Coffea eugenioides]|uniref:Protein cornichon homolog 4-like n=1 Tax=Coffea arabica TaxID=13443 RepID=A0A6P6TNQ1_COFAR|nr:protein cornichon homolog 4 [Coffea eugenioides]